MSGILFYETQCIRHLPYTERLNQPQLPTLKYTHMQRYVFKMVHHGLRGSASPVLTATGFVNGRWQVSTPHRIHTP